MQFWVDRKGTWIEFNVGPESSFRIRDVVRTLKKKEFFFRDSKNRSWEKKNGNQTRFFFFQGFKSIRKKIQSLKTSLCLWDQKKPPRALKRSKIWAKIKRGGISSENVATPFVLWSSSSSIFVGNAPQKKSLLKKFPYPAAAVSLKTWSSANELSCHTE